MVETWAQVFPVPYLTEEEIASSERNRMLEHLRMALGVQACPLLPCTDALGKRHLLGGGLRRMDVLEDKVLEGGGHLKGTWLAAVPVYIPSFLFKTLSLFSPVFPEDSIQMEWLLSPFKTNVQYFLISTSELDVQYLHGAIFRSLFLFLNQKSCL